MKAVAYLRVSTNRQEISLEDQAEKVRAYCAMRGLELVEVVTDEGVSGSVPLSERPGGRRVAEALKLHQAQHVVGLKLDRLFRDAADALAQTRSWDRSGIALHLVDMGGGTVDTSSPMGRMLLTMLAGFAEFERALIAERTRAALQHLLAQGRRAGEIKYGFRLVEGSTTQLEEDPDEQLVITLARDLRAQGRKLREIAEALTAAGYLSRAGKPFMTGSVARMVAA